MDWYSRTAWFRRNLWAGHLIAVGLALSAYGVRLVIGPILTGFSFITFFPAILLTAYLAGRRAGFLCLAISAALAWFYLVEPAQSFKLAWPSGVIAMTFFLFNGGVMVLLVSAMNDAYDRLAAIERERARVNDTLEERVRERTEELASTNTRLTAEMQARAAAESRAAQMQRLEAVGQLTGGVAHDFNNMLAIVIGQLDLALIKLARGSTDIARHLEGALDGANRGAQLTQQLLAFARRQPLAPAVINLNRSVSEASELVRRTLGERIQVECVLAGGLWLTRIDPGQLVSALVNLAVNARDAMPEGGKLTIETMNAHLDDHYIETNSDVAAGQYVAVAVTDTGTGMSKEIAAQAFEPFFTTKETGQGTGLGLSQIYGFAKQSGGHAKIYSEVGHGTTVKLYFPRHFGDAIDTLSDFDASSDATPLGSRREKVLVVEDEPAVRAVTVETLHDLGYTVLEASDGRAALRIVEEESDLALMLTDVVMPGLSGKELADQACARRPALKVLYMTGYTRNAIVHGGQLDPGVNLISKPFTASQLARKVKSVIEG